jgi:hypothetical protein
VIEIEKKIIIKEKIDGYKVFDMLNECNKNRQKKLALQFYVLKPRGNRHIFYIANDIQKGRRELFNPMWCGDTFRLSEFFYVIKTYDFSGKFTVDFLNKNYDLIDYNSEEIEMSKTRWNKLMKIINEK